MESDLAVHILPHNQEDVQSDAALARLNQLGFVRASTPQEQFLILMNDAWHKTKLPMNLTLRDYLAVMLNRFLGRRDLLDQLAGFEYCSYLTGRKSVDPETMHDLADISLQYVAFFPGMSDARYQMRSLEYSTQIGESLYTRLAKDSVKKDDWFSEAWQLMARSFGLAVMVLRSAFPHYSFVKNSGPSPSSGQVAQTDWEVTKKLDQWRMFDQMFFQQTGAAPQLKN